MTDGLAEPQLGKPSAPDHRPNDITCTQSVAGLASNELDRNVNPTFMPTCATRRFAVNNHQRTERLLKTTVFSELELMNQFTGLKSCQFKIHMYARESRRRAKADITDIINANE